MNTNNKNLDYFLCFNTTFMLFHLLFWLSNQRIFVWVPYRCFKTKIALLVEKCTNRRQQVEGLVRYDVRRVVVHETGTNPGEVVELIQSSRIKYGTDVGYTESLAKEVGNSCLQVNKSVLVGQTEDIQDNILLQCWQTD